MSHPPNTAPPTDRLGLELTTGPEAAGLYREGIDRLLALAEGAPECFEGAIRADERFSLAYAALALAHLVDGRPARARGALMRARSPLAGQPLPATPATRRERWHLEIVAAGVAGDDARARELAVAHLREFPRDLLVLAFLVIGAQRSGGPGERADVARLAAELAPHHGDDWAFLSLRAYVLEELGRTDQALSLALRALELHPACAQAAHVVAHVRYERGEHEEGRRFLAEWLEAQTPSAPTLVHLRWHQALFDLALLDPRAAVGAYERWIRPAAAAGVPGALIAASGLLWRLALDGRDAPLSWKDIHQKAALATDGAGSALADLHIALALAGAGDVPALDRVAAAQNALACRGDAAAGAAVLPAALGLRALVAGEPSAAAAHLEIALGGLELIAGGNAQRRLLEDTLLEACLRAGRYEVAERRLRARIEGQRATARDLMLLDRALAGLHPLTPTFGRRRRVRPADSERTPSTRTASSRRGPLSSREAPISPASA